MNWTKEQQDAIYKKDSNILVAAAAGSGKTAVLVERIIQKIITDKVDINKLLVVTFTNAAASEMRERVLEAIYKKIDEMPDDENLKRQVVLLGKSNICTIHSFCLEVIRNNFFKIGLPANFRIASEEENEILKQEVLDDVLEKLYDEESEDIKRLVEIYTNYRGDEGLKEIILDVYKFIQSSPFPNEWLNENVDYFKLEDIEDFAKTTFGKIILDNLKEAIEDGIKNLRNVKNKIEIYPELEKHKMVLEDDIEKLMDIYEATSVSWDETFIRMCNLQYKMWPRDKVDMEIKDRAKEIRDTVKDKIKDIVKKYFTANSEEAIFEIREMYSILDSLRKIVIEYGIEYANRKREKNIIDFNDIEHFALKILVTKDEKGNRVPTETAKEYMEKFEEIAIDEYQDSNEVQEAILTSVSKNNNIFMVGDVKQSIYKFRKACPKLFLDKYNTYSLGEANNKGLKIQLFKNFRSRVNVLDFTNMIFKNIMSESLGEIDYTKDEYLNLGAEYLELENGVGNAELYLIDSAKTEEDERNYFYDSEQEESDDSEVVEVELENLEKEEIEAKFVAKKIEELVKNKYQVVDKKLGVRDIKYKDIVILLRSTLKTAPIFEKELLKRNIPVFSDSANEYLDSIEIQTVISLLKIIDNPTDDISLVSVLRSKMFEFTDNEILEIRLVNREISFYNTLLEATEKLENNYLKEKLNLFLNKLKEWQEKSKFVSLSELIWEIYEYTGFYHYSMLMPNGTLRAQNLKMLFERAKEYEKTSFKGLYNFIRFIERIKSSSSDLSSAKVIGESEDVVRIMSIHKSKGLEFPVVFLSCAAKKFNFMDLNKKVLMHQELGFGPEYISYNRKVKYPTLAKEALKILTRTETISEEMRVLYVALTRAKEKLIITSVIDDIQKFDNKLNADLDVYNISEETEKVNPILLKKYTRYIDWINLIYNKNKNQNLITRYDLRKEDVFLGEEEVILENNEIEFNKEFSNEELEKIDNLLSFDYRYKILSEMPSKTTVSKIKEEANDKIEFEENKDIGGIADIVPSFIDNEAGNVSAKKGTLMHLFMQKIGFRREYTLDELKELLEELVAKKIILEEDKKLINLYKILEFTKNDLYKEISDSKVIEKEKTFCMRIKLSDYQDYGEKVSNEEILNNEYVLVQGIIDLYSIKEDGNIILVDYKTDFIEEGNENVLVERYKKQMQLYKKCLEEGLGKVVSDIYIYSLYLNKKIKLDI